MRLFLKHFCVVCVLAYCWFGWAHSSADKPPLPVVHGIVEQLLSTQNGFEVATILVREVAETSPSLLLETYFVIDKYSTSVFQVFEGNSAWCSYEELRIGQEVLVWFATRHRADTYPSKFDALLIGIVREGTAQFAADFKDFPEKSAERPIHVGTLIERALHKPDPVCPEESVAFLRPQFVLVEVLIGEEGGVEDAAIWKGSPSLVGSALRTARQWRFKPNFHGGVPVKVVGFIPLLFCPEGK